MEKRLLCVFSHPDDESYGPAGTIRHVASGIDGRVRVVIATRGEAGSIGISKNYPPHDLARVRQAEALASGSILDIEIALLGFPDKGIASLSDEEALPPVVREIRSFRPQVVLAFHPNGISGHPDHIAMTRLARLAFDRAADPAFTTGRSTNSADPSPWQADRLFYWSVPRSAARLLETVRTLQAVEDSEIDVEMDVTAHIARKHAACLVHGTQTDFHRRLSEAPGGIDGFWSTEHHILAAWKGERPRGPLRDIFEGIDDTG